MMLQESVWALSDVLCVMLVQYYYKLVLNLKLVLKRLVLKKLVFSKVSII